MRKKTYPAREQVERKAEKGWEAIPLRSQRVWFHSWKATADLPRYWTRIRLQVFLRAQRLHNLGRRL